MSLGVCVWGVGGGRVVDCGWRWVIVMGMGRGDKKAGFGEGFVVFPCMMVKLVSCQL